MKVGIIGTGAIAGKHAQAYKNIGNELTACTDRTAEKGEKFAASWGAQFVATPEELTRRGDVDYLDVCTFPAYRLEAVELGAKFGKHVLVQKPISGGSSSSGIDDCGRAGCGNPAWRRKPASFRRFRYCS